MKFGCSTSIFHLRPLSEAIDGIGRAGFDAMELVAEKPHAFPEDMTAVQIAGLHQRIGELKMRICNINACGATITGEIRDSSWIEENWKPREIRIRYTLDCMRMAAAVGVPYVTTHGAGVISKFMNRRDGMALFAANVERVLPLSRKLGVKLLLQPEAGLLIETAEDALDLLSELSANDCVGINFDAAHFFCAGVDPCEAWEKLKDHVMHVHLSDIPADRRHRHTQLGEGAMDIAAFLECVRKSGYSGYVTIKLDSYEQRAEEIILASAEYLRSRGFWGADA